jgi:hypothetical protein
MSDHVKSVRQTEPGGLRESQPAGTEKGRVVSGEVTSPITDVSGVAVPSAFARPNLRCE